jgi:hypothetical protein
MSTYQTGAPPAPTTACLQCRGLAHGRARWAAGQIGESAYPGQRVSAEGPLLRCARAACGWVSVWPMLANGWRRS